ncbi:MAG: hypothetical protein ACHQYP_11365 [Nitrospiria bacterium]
MTERIFEMLKGCSTSTRNFPPTILYNESWLLRIILDWFSNHKTENYALTFLNGAIWFSEAALPSQFLNSPSKDRKLAEGWSIADGVIGHFEVGKGHKIDLSFRSGGTQLVVLEAKMFSPLANRTSNTKNYDQTARIVACIAETLFRANHHPTEMAHLGFYILAPASQIDGATFVSKISRDSIKEKVEQRVKEYVEAGDGKKNDWYFNYFLPMLLKIELGALKWEDVIQEIERNDPISANSIRQFYNQCVNFGKRPSA